MQFTIINKTRIHKEINACRKCLRNTREEHASNESKRRNHKEFQRWRKRKKDVVKSNEEERQAFDTKVRKK